MQDPALELLRSNLDDAHLTLFAGRLNEWLVADLNQGEGEAPAFTDSRAKALLRAADVVDSPTLHSFARLLGEEGDGLTTAVRVFLYRLLHESDLAENEGVLALATTSRAAELPVETAPVPWLSLAVAAFAWKSGYPLHQLDPTYPPEAHSPAGLLLKRAGHFVRQQVQHSATERDKLGHRLAFQGGGMGANAPDLEELPQQSPLAPLPPHYRPPIPVNYPEVSRDTLHVEPDEPNEETTVVPRAEPITITDEDVSPDQPVQRMPPIRITRDQVQSPPPTRVVTPQASPPPLANFTKAVRQRFGRSREPFTTVKLRIQVQEYPDGPGLYGLQVRVTCQGVRSQVAGTTNRDGKLLCELPVRLRSGLTYDVDVTWPRDLGGNVERKSITLNADRKEFTLPFYHQLNA
jgi:hypothetical protein